MIAYERMSYPFNIKQLDSYMFVTVSSQIILLDLFGVFKAFPMSIRKIITSRSHINMFIIDSF